MNTIKYLQDAKCKLQIESDYALAKRLGITTAAISQYQTGKRVIDPYTAAKLAEVLEIDPMEIVAAAEEEREKDEKKREFWRTLSRKLAGTALTAVLMFSSFNRLETENFNEPAIMRNYNTKHFELLLPWRRLSISAPPSAKRSLRNFSFSPSPRHSPRQGKEVAIARENNTSY